MNPNSRYNPYGGGPATSRYQVPATLNPPAASPPKPSQEDTSGSSMVGGLFAGVTGIFSGAAKGILSAIAGDCAKPRTPRKEMRLSQPVGIGSPLPGALDDSMEPYIDQDRNDMMRKILNDRTLSVQSRHTIVKAMLSPGQPPQNQSSQLGSRMGNPSFSANDDTFSHNGSLHNSTRPFASFSTDRSRQRGPIRALNTGEVLNRITRFDGLASISLGQPVKIFPKSPSPAPSAQGFRSRGLKGTPPALGGGFNGQPQYYPRRAMSVAAGGIGRRESPMSRPLTSMSHRRNHSASKLRPLNPRLGPAPSGRLSSRRHTLPVYHPTYDRSTFSWERLHKRSRYERDSNGQLKLNFTDPMVDRALKRHKASPGGYKPNLAFTKEDGDNYVSKSIFSGVTKSRLRPKASKASAPPAVSSPVYPVPKDKQSPTKPVKLSFSKVSSNLSTVSTGSMEVDKSNTSVGSDSQCILASQQPVDTDMLSGPMSPSKISLPRLTDKSTKESKPKKTEPISLFGGPKDDKKPGFAFPASSSTSSLFAPKIVAAPPVAGSLFGGSDTSSTKKTVKQSSTTSSLFSGSSSNLFGNGPASDATSSAASAASDMSPTGKKRKRQKSSPTAVPKLAPTNTGMSLFGLPKSTLEADNKEDKKPAARVEEKKPTGELFPTLFGNPKPANGTNGKENKPAAEAEKEKPGSGKLQLSKESPFASVAATSAAEKAQKPAKPAEKPKPKLAVSFACRQGALLRIKVQEHYEEKIKRLYKTHCTEKLEDKMARALKKFEKYKPNREEHDFYVKLCDNYNVDPGPPYTGVDPEPEDEPEPPKTESDPAKASTSTFSFSAPAPASKPVANPFALPSSGSQPAGKIGAGLFGAASNGGAKPAPPPAVMPPPSADKTAQPLTNPFAKPADGKKSSGFNMSGSPFKPSPFSTNGPSASKENKAGSTNLFGGSSNGGGNLFGGASQTSKPTGSSLFGNSSSSNPFASGGSASQPAASNGGGIFGNSQPSNSQPSGGIFGGSGSNGSGSHPFAMNTGGNQSSGTTNLFASSNSQNSNTFGGSSGSNPFGKPATASSGGLFGNANTNNSKPPNPFASASNSPNPFASGGTNSPFAGNRNSGPKFSMGKVSSRRGRGRRPIVRGKRSIPRK